uniref:Uncharacterized protein n=1 Tax=viral metagenome TaxID=1070528 RepID=A0A6C0H8A1_9ZZZZ
MTEQTTSQIFDLMGLLFRQLPNPDTEQTTLPVFNLTRNIYQEFQNLYTNHQILVRDHEKLKQTSENQRQNIASLSDKEARLRQAYEKLLKDNDEQREELARLKRDNKNLRTMSLKNPPIATSTSSGQTNPACVCVCCDEEKHKFCYEKKIAGDCYCDRIHADQVTEGTLYGFVMLLLLRTKRDKACKDLHLEVCRGIQWTERTDEVAMRNVFVHLQEVNPTLNWVDAQSFFRPLRS